MRVFTLLLIKVAEGGDIKQKYMTGENLLDFDDPAEIINLESKVLGQVANLLDKGYIPLQPYETHVSMICDFLRSWCRSRVDYDENIIVDHLAKAFIRFIMASEFKDDPETCLNMMYYEDFCDEATYETFTECLLADVCNEWQRMNHGLVGLREFLKSNTNN